MTNTEKRLELLEQLVKEVTDYGFNDEYGYYNDWADGVRPILEKAIAQALAEDRERVVGEAEEMRIRFNKKNILIYQIEIENYNMGIDDVISLVLDKPDKS